MLKCPEQSWCVLPLVIYTALCEVEQLKVYTVCKPNRRWCASEKKNDKKWIKLMQSLKEEKKTQKSNSCQREFQNQMPHPVHLSTLTWLFDWLLCWWLGKNKGQPKRATGAAEQWRCVCALATRNGNAKQQHLGVFEFLENWPESCMESVEIVWF